MQRIFLSYTYHPHPEHVAETDSLQRTIRRVVEAMGLHVVDGLDVGGRVVETEIDSRIRGSDALVALLTPQADVANGRIAPDYVNSEFQTARALGKSRIRVLHNELVVRGLGTNEEYVPFDPAKTLDVVIKLMQTLALWKKELGRPVQIQIQPDQLANRFDSRRNDRCEYELMLGDGRALPAQTTTLWPEPGAAYVHVPNFVEGAKVRVHLTVDGESWRSPFVLPQMGGVALVKV